jgi:hypothetical protein
MTRFALCKLAAVALCLWLCCVIGCASKQEMKQGGGKEKTGVGAVALQQQGAINYSYVGMGVGTLLLWLIASLLREHIKQKHETERLKEVVRLSGIEAEASSPSQPPDERSS